MERKISSKKYLIAFILTVIIFFGGILTGMALEKARLNDSKQINLNEKLNLRSLQLQETYIDSGFSDCNALNKVIETNIHELAKKMSIIIDYDKESIFSPDEFDLQLRDYFLTEVQFLLISQEIDQKCEKDNVKVIYFYDDDENDTQGKILDYIKKKLQNKVLVFSFNSAFKDEPMIEILLESYNITTFPSVVVENNVLQGHTKVEPLFKAICNEFTKRAKPEECKKLTS